MTVRWFASTGGGRCEFCVQEHLDQPTDEMAPFSYVRGRGPPLGDYRGKGGAPALEVGL